MICKFVGNNSPVEPPAPAQSGAGLRTSLGAGLLTSPLLGPKVSHAANRCPAKKETFGQELVRGREALAQLRSCPSRSVTGCRCSCHRLLANSDRERFTLATKSIVQKSWSNSGLFTLLSTASPKTTKQWHDRRDTAIKQGHPSRTCGAALLATPKLLGKVAIAFISSTPSANVYSCLRSFVRFLADRVAVLVATASYEQNIAWRHEGDYKEGAFGPLRLHYDSTS